MPNFNIRPAKSEETSLVLEFIKKLAAYEKCSDEVVADEATLYQSLFVEKAAEVIFAEEDGVVIGFALFFHNFSTFVGRKGLYLEDIFIIPEKRGLGYGKAILKYLADIAIERNCGRMEWICLDWNTPSLAFYRSIGAIPLDEWTVQRMTEDVVKEFASPHRNISYQSGRGDSSHVSTPSSLQLSCKTFAVSLQSKFR